MLKKLETLTSAERVFLAETPEASFTRIGDGIPPMDGASDRIIRAELIRYVLMRVEGAPKLHEKGLRLSGAIISGALDLEGCRLPFDVRLADCRFESALVLRSSTLETLLLDGSTLPGLLAEKLTARGGVYLRGASIEGPADLRGAQIGGGLIADGASITRPGDDALAADGIDVRGGMLLRGAIIHGAIAIVGGRLGGDFDASGAELVNPGRDVLRAEGLETRGDVLLRRARVTGCIVLTGARVSGDVDLGGGGFAAPGADALLLNRAKVEGALMMREGATIDGLLNLNGTSVDAVVDTPESWPATGDIALNRFIYKGFLAAPSAAAVRLDWLSRQAPERWGEDFWPQPYEQLAAVLADSGQPRDSRRVLITKERLQRRAQRARMKPWAARALLWAADGVLDVTIGYGLRPLRATLWLFLFWLVGVAIFSAAEQAAAVRPAAVLAVRSPEWVLCGVQAPDTVMMVSLGVARMGLARPGEPQLHCWRRQLEADAYTKFNPWMFAFDKLLPGSASDQADAWALDTRTVMGAAAKRAGHVLGAIGGALSLLAIAGFSGIVRSD